jgi:hypothetical protein
MTSNDGEKKVKKKKKFLGGKMQNFRSGPIIKKGETA